MDVARSLTSERRETTMAHRLTAVSPDDKMDPNVRAMLDAYGYTDVKITPTLTLPTDDPEKTYLRFSSAHTGSRQLLDALESAQRVILEGSRTETVIRIDGTKIYLVNNNIDFFIFGSMELEDFLYLYGCSRQQPASTRIFGLLVHPEEHGRFHEIEPNLSYEEATERIGWDWRHPENDNVFASVSL